MSDSTAIPVSRLLELCNPFTNPWNGDEFTISDVQQAVLEQRFEKDAWTPHAESGEGGHDWPVSRHVARIAYLVVHGWTDPVQVDVGIPSMGFAVPWPLTDGNHRLAAAVARGDEQIEASICGSVTHAMELFGVAI